MNSILQYCNEKKLFKTEEDFNRWFNIVSIILNNEEFLKRKAFKHHENQSVYEHCLMVSAISYNLAIKFRANIANCVIAGLLHDFYTSAWQYSEKLESLDKKYRENFLPGNKKKSFLKMHGFTHAISAVGNSKENFPDLINYRILNAIATHMFPLCIFTKYKIPKYKESWIVTIADDIATFKDLPTIKELPKYFGIMKKNNRI